MFPLMLNVTTAPIMVIGGAGIVARLAMLEEYGATAVQAFCSAPTAHVRAAAGPALTERWPSQDDFVHIRPRLAFIMDMDDALAGALRAHANAVGALVHVQDRLPLCDFHLPARLRRGQLQVTVSTHGAAPGLSRLVRDYLAEQALGPEWSARVAEIAAARQGWKRDGRSITEIGRALADFVAARGWLKGR